jgi:flagellar biosynthesis protein FlhG
VIDQASHLRGLMQQAERQAAGIGAQPGHYAAVSSHPPHPISIPSGAVSYAPADGRQPVGVADGHWNVSGPRHSNQPPRAAPRLARAIAVSSGKGGVGKSNLAVNLAVAMSAAGKKVCLLDADLGLANADVLCNLSPRLTLEHVVSGECRLVDAMVLAPGGFRLIPGASGVRRLADLTVVHRQALLQQLAALEAVADVILIDCGAGINANVVGFAAAANSVVITTTPEPTALTDGYGMIKALAQVDALARCGDHARLAMNTELAKPPGRPFTKPHPVIYLVVNMAADAGEGRRVFDRVNRVSRTFLNRDLEYGGTIPNDAAVPAAVRQRVPFVLHAPNSSATTAVRRLAAKLAGTDCASDIVIDQPRAGFFTRLALRLGIIEDVDD